MSSATFHILHAAAKGAKGLDQTIPGDAAPKCDWTGAPNFWSTTGSEDIRQSAQDHRNRDDNGIPLGGFEFSYENGSICWLGSTAYADANLMESEVGRIERALSSLESAVRYLDERFPGGRICVMDALPPAISKSNDANGRWRNLLRELDENLSISLDVEHSFEGWKAEQHDLDSHLNLHNETIFRNAARLMHTAIPSHDIASTWWRPWDDPPVTEAEKYDYIASRDGPSDEWRKTEDETFVFGNKLDASFAWRAGISKEFREKMFGGWTFDLADFVNQTQKRRAITTNDLLRFKNGDIPYLFREEDYPPVDLHIDAAIVETTKLVKTGRAVMYSEIPPDLNISPANIIEQGEKFRYIGDLSITGINDATPDIYYSRFFPTFQHGWLRKSQHY